MMIGSAAYWYGIQSALTTNVPVALAYTAILTIAPPTLISFLIPSTPAGMFLQRINAQTVGYPVVIVCSFILLYYSYYLLTSYWTAQPVAQSANVVHHQMLIGIIGFILIPGLLAAPVSSTELVEQMRQAHLVQRYELQTQADIQILRATLLRAQQLSMKGFSNLSDGERRELVDAMNGLVIGINETMKEVGSTVRALSGVQLPYNNYLADDDDIVEVLGYLSDELEGTNGNERNNSAVISRARRS